MSLWPILLFLGLAGPSTADAQRADDDAEIRKVLGTYVDSARKEAAAARGKGQFIGEPRLLFLPDGRKMRLLTPFAYRDSHGTLWTSPAGAKTDGASIPRPVWALVGGPFEGKYRTAAIIHDRYCDTKTRSWQDTHRVFLDAMLTAGESKAKAQMLYYAVYRFGPRWGCPIDRGCYRGQLYTPAFDKAQFDNVEQRIQRGEIGGFSELESIAKEQDDHLWDATPHIRYEAPQRPGQ